MGLETATLAAIGVGIGAVGTVGSFVMGQKQAKQAEKAAAFQRQAEAQKAMRQRRRAAAQARAARAEVVQAGANQGASSSSAVIGGAAGVATQGAAQQTFLDATSGLLSKASTASAKAAKYGSMASGFASLGSFGQTVFSNADSIGKVFSSATGNNFDKAEFA